MWLQVGQLHINTGWQDVPLASWSSAESFKNQCYIFRFIIVGVWWSLECEVKYMEREEKHNIFFIAKMLSLGGFSL